VPLGDVDEGACGGRYGLAILKVEGQPSIKDVERLIVRRMDVKRGGRPSGSQLLDEQELSASLLGGSFHSYQHTEKPQRFSFLGTEHSGG